MFLFNIYLRLQLREDFWGINPFSLFVSSSFSSILSELVSLHQYDILFSFSIFFYCCSSVTVCSRFILVILPSIKYCLFIRCLVHVMSYFPSNSCLPPSQNPRGQLPKSGLVQFNRICFIHSSNYCCWFWFHPGYFIFPVRSNKLTSISPPPSGEAPNGGDQHFHTGKSICKKKKEKCPFNLTFLDQILFLSLTSTFLSSISDFFKIKFIFLCYTIHIFSFT